MQLVTVIPIARGISTDELTYFGADDIAPGAVVIVPVRRREIPALVTHTAPIADQKAALRSADFSLKKVLRTQSVGLLSPVFLKAASALADYSASTLGAMLAAVVPKQVLMGNVEIPTSTASKTVPQHKKHPIHIVQDTFTNRLAIYEKLTQKTLKQGRSVFLITPTREHVRKLAEHFPEALALDTTLAKTRFLKRWQNALQTSSPTLVIGTGSALALPRNNIGLIIIEHEHSKNFKGQTRPYVDIRILAHAMSEATDAELVLGDEILRIETLWHFKEKKYKAASPLAWQYTNKVATNIIDMRRKPADDTNAFEILSSELKDRLAHLETHSEHLLLLTARRGLAGVTVCNDCGESVRCARCTAPVVLHGSTRSPQAHTRDERTFVCHHCGAKRSAAEKCKNCTSWNLVALGIGIERVEETLKHDFPGLPVFRADSDAAPKEKDLQKQIRTWQESPSGVLLATERALRHIDRTDHTAVASIDTFFAIPDFRMNERIFRLLHTLAGIAEKSCIVQTRYPESHVLDYALSGNIEALYEEEIKERKQFGYPPFTTLVKIRTQGTPESTEKAEAHLTQALANYSPLFFRGAAPHSHTQEVLNALITLPQSTWPDKALLQKLRALPPQFAVIVDPESIL